MPKTCPVRIVEPYSHTYRIGVKPSDAGNTLLVFLHQRFPYLTMEKWQERHINGQIRVNEVLVAGNVVLNAHDQISIFQPRVTEPSVPDTVRIHAENERWVWVEKPAPMPVHSGGRYHKNTLAGILAAEGYVGLRPVHRLDSVTSGLILFAKDAVSADLAGKALQRTAHKVYYALTEGFPDEDVFTVNRPVFRKSGFVFDTGATPESREAITHFEVVKRFGTGTLVRCLPQTGRTHQIRLHLRDAGCPIAGDLVYQTSDNNVVQNRAVALFSAELHLPDLELSAAIAYPESWNYETAWHDFR